jgi:MFS family permease
VLVGLHLAAVGLDAGSIGLVVGAGLTGAACGTLVATLAADTIGRRRLLVGLALLSFAGAIVVAFGRGSWVLGAGAFIGMVNGMGRDRGAGLVLEQALLPATVPDASRTRAFAVYNVLQDAGHAFGGLLAGLPQLLRETSGLEPAASFRAVVILYAVLAVLPVPLYLRLSGAVEAPAAARHPLTPESRRIVTRISALFALDSLGGGFLTTALLSFFFYERFGASELTIGALFFGARAANAFSHLGAAWLAKRIGLVNTMVFTHIPSSLLLVTVAFAPNLAVAAVLFLLREGLVEMDVPTRQSYVMAVVRPEERTRASGVTHLVRMAAWAVAPAFAGLFMEKGGLVVPLVVGAVMKVVYDVLLYVAFRHTRPPEERASRVL